jgi:hypothetical protein
MDYEQRDAFFFSKFSDKGTEDGLFLSFFLPTAIVILFMQSCKKCGRKDVRNDRPTDNRLSVSTPEVKLCIQYPLSFPFLYYFEFGFSKRERTDEMVM